MALMFSGNAVPQEQDDDVKAILGKLNAKRRVARSLDDDELLSEVTNWLPSGCLAFRRVAGTLGFPYGRITEISGLEQTCKSAIGDLALAECQRQGGIAILADTESARTQEYSREVSGLNLPGVIILEPQTLEDVFDQVMRTILLARETNPQRPIAVFIDSLGGVNSREVKAIAIARVLGKKYKNKKIGEAHSSPGTNARVISTGIAELKDVARDSNAAVIIANQVYTNINAGFGEPAEKTLGGNKLRYLTSLRVKATHRGRLVTGEGKDRRAIGFVAELESIKNRHGDCFETSKFAYVFANGIDNVWTLWNEIPKTVGGSWTTIGGLPGKFAKMKFQGMDDFRRKATADPDLWTAAVDLFMSKG